MQASGHPTTSSTDPPMCPSWPRFRISDRRPICVHELTLTHTYAGLHLRCDPRHRRVSGPDRPRGLPNARTGRQEACTASSRSAESPRVGLDRSSKLRRSVPRTFFDTIYTTYIGTVNALTNLVGTRRKGSGVQQNSIAKRLPRRGLESASPTV